MVKPGRWESKICLENGSWPRRRCDGVNGTEMAGLIPVRFDIIIVGSLFTFRGVEEVIADGEEKAQEEAFNL